MAGAFLAFISLMAVVAAWLIPRAVKGLGEFTTLYLAFLAYAAAHLLLAFSSDPGGLIAAGILMGCGFGLSVPLVNHLVVEHSPDSRRGQNLAYLSMAIFSGQFCSSFMELIPGNRSGIFCSAAGIALMVVPVLWRFHASQHKEARESQTLP
ncbi:MFS transporter [Erwinia billingiae]|uniref:MFS transporter n=1 Tax=Erwinia billingiae TaxID=182337 RepID=UPI0030D60C07